MLRQSDLIRLQFEYLANPYYNDVDTSEVQMPRTLTLFEDFDKIIDDLTAVCKKDDSYAPRAIFYKQQFKSFNNIWMYWLKA